MIADAAPFRAPPYSLESEQSVIGGLLLNPAALDRIAFLRPAHFFRDDHRLIFEAIRDVLDDLHACDVLIVAERLHKNGNLARCNGVEYLQAIVAGTPSATNIRLYAETIRDRWQLRTLAREAESIADGAYSLDGRNARELLEDAQARMMALTEQAGTASEPQRVADLMAAFNELMQRRACGDIVGIPSGFSELDARVVFEPGDLVIVGARPGTGKTAFVSQWLEQAAKRGHRSLLFSMEMPMLQIVARSLSRHSGVPLAHILSGKASGSAAVLDVQAQLSRLPFMIDDSAPAPIQEVRAKARAVKRRDGLDVLALDYLQLMPGTGASGKNRNEDLSDVTRGLKALARELSIVVIALSQLSRKCEERVDKRPQLSDLRDSGAIEQDADIVMLGFRHENYYPRDLDWQGVAEWNVAKYRNGQPANVPFVFDGTLTRFDSYRGNWPIVQTSRKQSRGFGGVSNDE